MFVLTELNNVEAITNSAQVNVNGENYLFIAEGNRIRIYESNSNLLQYKLKCCKILHHKVLSWTRFAFNVKNFMIYIDDEFHVQLIDVLQIIKSEVDLQFKPYSLFRMSIKGQQQSLSFEKPMIIPQSVVNPEFVIFHVFHSNVQVLPMLKLMQSICEAKYDESNEWLFPQQYRPSPVTIPMGNIDILQIVSMSDDDDNNKGEELVLEQEEEGGEGREGINSRKRGRKVKYGDRNGEFPTKTTQFAILYKDLFLSYSIRLVNFDTRRRSANILHQMDQFEEDPSLIVPWSKGKTLGLVALTPSSLFYFPDKSIAHMSLANSLGRNIAVSKQMEDPIMVMTLDKPSKDKALRIYKSYFVIDNSRTLLVTELGECFMLYIDIHQSSPNSLVINQVNFINLGILTPPIRDGLHHVRSNLFFQSSRSSKSVLFEVLATKPNLDIHDVLESSPPVLDIAKFSTRSNLYACQGGWDGSLIRFYRLAHEKGVYGMVLQNGVIAGQHHHLQQHLQLVLIGRVKGKYLFRDYSVTTSKKYVFLDSTGNLQHITVSDILDDIIERDEVKGHSIVITTNAFKIDSKVIADGKVLYGRILAENNTAVVIMEHNRAMIYQYDIVEKPTFLRFLLESSEAEEQVSFVDICRLKGKLCVLITFSSGRIELWLEIDEQHKGRKLILVCKKLISQGVYSAALVVRSLQYGCNAKLFLIDVFILCAYGSIQQLVVEIDLTNNTAVIVDNGKLQLQSREPYRIKKLFNKLVLYNSQFLVLPYFDKSFEIYEYSLIRKPNTTDVIFLDTDSKSLNKSRILITFATGLVEVADIIYKNQNEKLVEQHSLHLQKLFVKCMTLPMNRYMIALSYDKNSGQNMQAELLLIDSQTFVVLDSFKLENTPGVADMCLLEEGPLEVPNKCKADFITLSSLEESPISMFCVRDLKIKLVEKCAIKGLRLNKNVQLQNISALKNDKKEHRQLELDDQMQDVQDVQDPNCITFVISGTVIFTVLLSYDGSRYIWELGQDLFSMPTYAIGHVSLYPLIIAADAVAGLCSFTLNSLRHQEPLHHQDLEREYLTSIALTGLNGGNANHYVITGDTLGYIRISNKRSSERVGAKFCVMASSTINVIVPLSGERHGIVSDLALIGTSSGGIYLLSEIIDKFDKPFGDHALAALVEFGTEIGVQKIIGENFQQTDESILSKEIINISAVKLFLERYKTEPKLHSQYREVIKLIPDLQKLVQSCAV